MTTDRPHARAHLLCAHPPTPANTWEQAIRDVPRADLGPLRTVAGRIESLLKGIDPLLNALCTQTCLHCPDICCLRALVWFDPRDRIYLYLNGHPLPDGQPLTTRGTGCRYASAKGCRQPRWLRPWVCTWYLCPTQMNRLRQPDWGPRKACLETAFRDIKALRRRLPQPPPHSLSLP